MNFQDAVKNVLSNYATFGGRARRAEYWWWVLFMLLGNIAFGILDGAIFGRAMMGHMQGNGPLTAVFSVLMLLPGLAVAARRLHDTDRSGWWLLLAFVPVIGVVVLLWWACTRGTQGPNRFGADPINDPLATA